MHSIFKKSAIIKKKKSNSYLGFFLEQHQHKTEKNSRYMIFTMDIKRLIINLENKYKSFSKRAFINLIYVR